MVTTRLDTWFSRFISATSPPAGELQYINQRKEGRKEGTNPNKFSYLFGKSSKLESTQTLDEATVALNQKLLSLLSLISGVAFSGTCSVVFQWIYPPSYVKLPLYLHPSFLV